MRLLKMKEPPIMAAPNPEIGDVLARIATTTSVIRTRAEDAERAARNGGTSREVFVRYASAAADLERVASALEARLS